MTNITTIMQTHLERIISEGNLSTDDIHNLSLVDRVLFQEVTNPRRVQTLWERHLPFPTLFLFDRPVHVYDYESESDEIGRVFEYSKKLYQGQQLVCRKLAASGKPDVLIAEEVKSWYDFWLSFFVGDRLKTVDDILFFRERHGKDFPDADYDQFTKENQDNGANWDPVYAEPAITFRYVLEGVKRFQQGQTLEDKRFDIMLKTALIPVIKKGYLHLDFLYSMLYLMGKECIAPGPFHFLQLIFSSFINADGSEPHKNDKQSMRDRIVQIAQVQYLFNLYTGGMPSHCYLYGLFPFLENPQDREFDKEFISVLSGLDDVPGYTSEGFSGSIYFDFSNRSMKTLATHLACFKEMVQGGYLTFDRLKVEYPCALPYQFKLFNCTPVFLQALSQKLISFRVLDSNFFDHLPFFFHLEDQNKIAVPEPLQNFSRSFLKFLETLKARGLQKDFEDFYAVPFFELFKTLTRYTDFGTPYEFTLLYSRYETGESGAENQLPFLTAVSQGHFTADSLMHTYKGFVGLIEQTLLKHISGLELPPEAHHVILNSRPCHALLMRLFIFSFLERIKSLEIETIEEAVTAYIKIFEVFCSEVITQAFIAIIVDDIFVKEFRELYDYFQLTNSFLKTVAGIEQCTSDKKQKFKGALSALDALEYMACLKKKGKELSFETLRNFTEKVQAFNRRVIELTSQYPFALPNDPMLIDLDLDIDEQLALYSLLSEEKTAEIYVEIARQYYVLMASLFGDKIALNLVNGMIIDPDFLKISTYIASGRWTMDQYSDFILSVLKMSFLARSRNLVCAVRIEPLIRLCMRVYMNALSQSIIERKEIDFSEAKSIVVQRFLLEPPPQEEVVEAPEAQDEAV